jgi:hypothetical protein
MQSISFETAQGSHTVAAPSWSEDALSAHNELERGAPFCSNPSCDLHIRLVDLQVEGGGNWVSLPDGRIFGRGRYGSRMLCDACGTRRGPVRVEPVRLEHGRLRLVR